MKRKYRIIGTIAALVVSAAAVGVVLASRGEADPVIAEVDGIPIYQSLADARIAGVADVHGDITTLLGDDWRRVILGTLVDDVILQMTAEGEGISVSEEEIDEKVASTRRLVETDQGWSEWLDAQQLDQKELRRRLRLQLLAGKVYDFVTAAAGVTDDDVRAFYDENPDQFTTETGLRPFLEVRDSIKETLTSESKAQVYRDWLETQRIRVEVVVVDDAWG